MGTHFIKVISVVNAYENGLFIPKTGDKWLLILFGLAEFCKQLTFLHEDYVAGSQIKEVRQAQRLSTHPTIKKHFLYNLETTSSPATKGCCKQKRPGPNHGRRGKAAPGGLG